MLTYEPVWNGTLERAGHCPTLSTYAGASCLAPFIQGTVGDPLTRAEVARAPQSKKKVPLLPRSPRTPSRKYDDQIVAMLRAGLTTKQIRRALLIGHEVIRRVTKEHGMTAGRRGSNQYKLQY